MRENVTITITNDETVVRIVSEIVGGKLSAILFSKDNESWLE
jgi:hypothetical protein